MDRREFLKTGVTGLVVVGAFPSLALEACSTTPQKSAASTSGSGLTLAEIETKARAEGGTIVFYGQGGPVANTLSNGFQTAYPWAKVQAFVLTGGALTSKVLTEGEAHASTADVVLVGSSQASALAAKNDIVPAHVPNDVKVPAGYRDPTGHLHAEYQVLQVLVYNKNLVQSPPTDIYELGNPSWKGKFVMDHPSSLGGGAFLLASPRAAWGDKKWYQWLQNMKNNDILLVPNLKACLQAVQSGERSIGTETINDIVRLPKGSPAVGAFYPHAPVSPVYLCRVTNGAHPYTALLFINWATSAEAETAVAAIGYPPVLPLDVPNALSRVIPNGYAPAAPSEYQDFLDHPDRYLTIFNKYWPV